MQILSMTFKISTFIKYTEDDIRNFLNEKFSAQFQQQQNQQRESRRQDQEERKNEDDEDRFDEESRMNYQNDEFERAGSISERVL